MRASRSERARNCRSSSDGVSAACRSSSTRTMGCASLAARRKEAVESKSRNLAPSGSMEGAGGRSGKSSWSSGSIWAMSAAPGANSSRMRSLSPSRICARRACTHGQYAGAPRPPSSGPSGPSPRAPGRATSVRPRAWSCRYRARRRSRTPTCAPRGPSSNAVRNSASSRSRPTNDSDGAAAPSGPGLRRPLPLFRDRALEIECGILFQDRRLEPPSAHVRVRCRAPRPGPGGRFRRRPAPRPVVRSGRGRA